MWILLAGHVTLHGHFLIFWFSPGLSADASVQILKCDDIVGIDGEFRFTATTVTMAFLSGGVQLDLVADFGFDLAAFDYDAMVYSFILYFPTCKIVLKHFWLDQIHLLLFGYIAHYEVVVSGVSIKG